MLWPDVWEEHAASTFTFHQPAHLGSEDGGSMYLQNVGNIANNHMV
jgi:hypothetical protein